MAPKQMTLASEMDAGFALHRKATRRDVFLAEMDKVVPWERLCSVVEPYYPKEPAEGEGGRRPIGLERMLGIHYQEGQPVVLRDEGPIGVDVNTDRVHTVTTTAANVADVNEVGHLLYGKENSVYADAGYIGADKRVPPKRGRDWFIAEKRGKVKATEDDELRNTLEQIEHLKASIRSKVEHPFRVLKHQFGYMKVRYRGLAKNGAQVTTLFALVNLWMARKQTLATTKGPRGGAQPVAV